ncbi:hypothetical protein [Allomuricauda sp. SCSIO 65647]|uniref:hypothetical protein n=1 Tax=Allomuricauda sp. SCSIO 65647 TaxID=2908843 RepID=UPI001F3C2854|nr:hypothetical protein [Muricauda sp. SCSIO 65647]UJH66651.1 hypothetical protein L0P89_11835 [Muricauda sp. SCSIO 65647]
MKKRLQIILVSSLCLLFLSCYYDQIVEEEIPDIPIDQPISFGDDILPLFSIDGRDCTTCHDGRIANPDLTEGNAYNAIVPEYVILGDGENSEFFKNLPGNEHPVEAGFSLTTDEIALIKGWIDRGAENN